MHTKEPWITTEGGMLDGDVVITTNTRIYNDIVPIVEIDTDYDGEIGVEQKANAKLILAAPELLKALKEIVKGAPTEQPERPDTGNASDDEKYVGAMVHWHYAEIARKAIAKAE